MTGLTSHLRTHLTYANVMSTIAVVAMLSTGTAYAAARIGSADVINDSLRSVDIKDSTLTGADIGSDRVGSADVAGLGSADIADESLTGADILDGDVNSADVHALVGGDIVDQSLDGSELASGAVGSGHVQDGTLSANDLGTGSVAADEVADGSIGSGELTPQAKKDLLPGAYHLTGGASVDTSATPSERQVVLSKELPEGTYVFHLAGDFFNGAVGAAPSVGCGVTIGGLDTGPSSGTVLGENDGDATNQEDFALAGWGSVPEGGGDIELECGAIQGAVDVGASLVAIRVSSVS